MGIDHEQRRREIAAMTIDLIAREGIGAATIRHIAAEGGFSTTAITHYFADKEELLVWAFEILSDEGKARFEAQFADAPDDLVGALLTMVPWCEVNRRRWKAYLAFWDEAARNPYLAGLVGQGTQTGLGQLERLLALGPAQPRDPAKAVRLLNALLQGMALQMLVDPVGWPEEAVRETLREAVDLAFGLADRPSQ
jgi:TetR/AcrR family transcriptional regulator, transcriptional repressor of bet genes